MTQFQYVRNTPEAGSAQSKYGTIEAASGDAALAALKGNTDVAPTSGVQEVKTPAPSPTPTPGSSPTATKTDTTGTSAAPGVTPQLTRVNVPSAVPVTPEGYDTAKAYTAVKTTEQLKADENQSRIDEMARVQAAIGGVNKQYDLKQEEQNRINTGNLGKTNAVSALMGLTGSAPAETRAGATEKTGQQAKDIIESQRATALQSIYDKVDENVRKAQEAALSTNRENAKALLDKVSISALETVQSLAATVGNNGASWDDFKATDPDTAQKLVEQSGKSEYALRELWKSKIPEQFKPVDHTSYRDDGKGGTIMTKVSFNPVTKKVDTQEYPIAAPLSVFNGVEKPLEVNGMLLVKQADGSYKNVAPEKPLTEKDRLENELTQSQINKNNRDTGGSTSDIKAENYDTAKLEAAQVFNEFVKKEEAKGNKNYDGKISPELYGEMRSKVPATLRDNFDRDFKDRLSIEAQSKFGIAPAKESALPAKIKGSIEALISKNAPLSDINDFVKFSGYDLSNQEVQDLIGDYTPSQEEGFKWPWNK